MTCREFKRTAASQTLRAFLHLDNQQLLDHSGQCPKCVAWLERQQRLAVAMQALQVRTSGCEAGPHVERALLGALRQGTFTIVQPGAAFRSAPIAFRLSRFFEVGAYVAAAAAMVVGLFLGVRLLEQRSGNGPLQSQSAQATKVRPQAAQTIGTTIQSKVAAAQSEQPPLPASRMAATRPAVFQSVAVQRHLVAAAEQTSDDADYISLMFCDPLICSADAQVVRMELPVAGAGDRNAETQLADVVVGDDGIVRAMRIVN